MKTRFLMATAAAAIVMVACNNEETDNWAGEIRLSSGLEAQQVTRSINPDLQGGQIADEVEEEVIKIQPIYEAIKEHPEADKEEIYKKIKVLRDACDTGDDLIAKEALRSVVPTFKTPEEVNKEIA